MRSRCMAIGRESIIAPEGLVLIEAGWLIAGSVYAKGPSGHEVTERLLSRGVISG